MPAPTDARIESVQQSMRRPHPAHERAEEDESLGGHEGRGLVERIMRRTVPERRAGRGTAHEQDTNTSRRPLKNLPWARSVWREAANRRRPATTSTAPVGSRGLIVGGRVRDKWIRLGACRREERPGHACGTKRKLRPAASAGGMGSGGARREPESQDTSVGAAVAGGASGHKSPGRPAGRPWMLRFSDSSGPRPGSRKDFSSNGLQTGPCPRTKQKSPVRLGRGWNPGGNRRRPVAEPVTDVR